MALTAQAPPPRVVSPRSVTHLDPSLLSPRSVSVLADIVIACAKRGRGRPAKIKSDYGGVSRKPSGRPRRKAAAASVAAAAVKIRRGRPKRSLKTLSATESLVAVDGSSRKRKRSKNDDVAAATVQAPANKKRGRKPKVAVKSVGRPKKGSKVAATEAADTRELKKKTALLQKKVKEAADKLSKAVAAIAEVQAIVNGM